MRWMRKAGAVAVAIAVVVLIPAPASAGTFFDPVDPLPYSPSQLQRVASGQGGAKSWSEMMQAARQYATKVTPGAATPAAPRILTEAENVVRGAQANVLVKGFSTGFMIGSAGLRLYQGFKPEDWPDAIPTSVCGDPVLSSVSSVLYFDLMPECAVPIDPAIVNADAVAGFGASTWNGMSVQFAGYSGSRLCITFTNKDPGRGTYWTDPVSKKPVQLKTRYLSSGAPIGVGGPESWSRGSCPSGQETNGNTWMGSYSTLIYFDFVDTAAGSLGVEPSMSSGDPLREATCTVGWSDGSTTVGYAGQYRESEGFPMGAVSAACESSTGEKVAQGLLPESISVDSKNTEDGVSTPVITPTIPDWTEDEKKGLTPGDNTGLKLWKVVNGQVLSCLTWDASCVSWWSKTAQGTAGQTDEGEYRCTYGGQAVGLAECAPYRYTFDTQTNTPTVTDPTTGEQMDWSSRPDPANQYGNGAQSQQSNDRCVTSFTLNPVDWVLRPMRCLFEPRQSKVDEAWNAARSKWDQTMPVRVVTLASSAFTVPTGISGCNGIRIFIPFSTVGAKFGWPDLDWRVFDACSGPAATVAQWSRWIGSAILIYATGLGVVRRASAIVNAPGLGGGGDSS